jgi:hypothetical protein
MLNIADNQFPQWPPADPAASTDPVDRMFAHAERLKGAMLRVRDKCEHDSDQRQVADEIITQALTLSTEEAVKVLLQRAHEELRS